MRPYSMRCHVCPVCNKTVDIPDEWTADEVEGNLRAECGWSPPPIGSSDNADSGGRYEWVTQTLTVDAIEREEVRAIEGNPGWRLLHVGTGSGGQTTLTYGWPWPAASPIGSSESQEDPRMWRHGPNGERLK